MRYLSADVGGTFTDIILTDDATGVTHVNKVPSTAGSAAAITAGICRVAAMAGIAVDDIDVFVHGFTIATNALLSRDGARTVLVVSEGFRDILEIGDQRRTSLYSLIASKPKPLVPRSRIIEARERIGAYGETVTALTEAEVQRVVAEVAQREPEVVAVSLLFSPIDPTHERILAAAIGAALSDVPVYLASDVNRQIEEYPRANTTVIAAYVGPLVKHYLDELEACLARLGLDAPLLLMRSDGGVATPAATRLNPAQMLLSGPAGGVIAATDLGHVMGIDDMVTFDMGGTSADFSMITGGLPRMVPARIVAGETLRLPTIDIETISAGGGSVAWVDVGGALKVGPDSAGAVPGPACYGQGGEHPTVTDALVVLGILDSGFHLGGELEVNAGLATEAVRRHVAVPLEIALEQAALGIIRVANTQMIEAIRVLSRARGRDVRRYALLAYGGGGPIFAAFIAHALAMPDILVPPRPGVFAASGLLMSDIRHHALRPFPCPLAEVESGELAGELDQMMVGLDGALARDGIDAADRSFQFTADMRSIGQYHELAIPLPRPTGSRWWRPEQIAEAFYQAHESAYGHADATVPVEIVNLRAEAIGRTAKAEFPVLGEEVPRDPIPWARRRVFLDTVHGHRECAIFRRRDLRPGDRLTGPSIIVQMDTTVLILAGQEGRVTRHGVIRIQQGQPG